MRPELLTEPLEPGDALALMVDAAFEGGVAAELWMRDRRRTAVMPDLDLPPVPLVLPEAFPVPGGLAGEQALGGRRVRGSRARITPRVRGVVSLSAESILRPATMVVHFVRRLRCPLLLVTADQDPYGSAQAARQFLAAAPSQAKHLLTVPGSDHGTALLAGRSAARTLPAILAFVHRVLG